MKTLQERAEEMNIYMGVQAIKANADKKKISSQKLLIRALFAFLMIETLIIFYITIK